MPWVVAVGVELSRRWRCAAGAVHLPAALEGDELLDVVGVEVDDLQEAHEKAFP